MSDSMIYPHLGRLIMDIHLQNDELTSFIDRLILNSSNPSYVDSSIEDAGDGENRSSAFSAAAQDAIDDMYPWKEYGG